MWSDRLKGYAEAKLITPSQMFIYIAKEMW